MTDTFTWRVHTTAAGRNQAAVNKAQFGDGYAQRSGQGINNNFQNWTITVEGYDVPGGISQVVAFLRAHSAVSFYWKAPLMPVARYVCPSFDINPQGGGLYTITAQFEQAFGS